VAALTRLENDASPLNVRGRSTSIEDASLAGERSRISKYLIMRHSESGGGGGAEKEVSNLFARHGGHSAPRRTISSRSAEVRRAAIELGDALRMGRRDKRTGMR